MGYKYIRVPQIVTINQIEENSYCLAPSKYSRFYPNKNVKYKTLKDLVEKSDSKTKVKTHRVYKYTEIGDIDVNTGFVEGSRVSGYFLPNKNPKKIQNGDILISTVRTYRGGVGLVTDDLIDMVCSPAIMVLREVDKTITKEYLFAVLKTRFFIEQILGFQNRGMYPRLDKNSMNYVYIPIPNDNKVVRFITLLVKAYFNKLKLIRERHEKILEKINNELTNNQKPNSFKYNYPDINELQNKQRLDTGLYNINFKYYDFLVRNYFHGSIDLISRGFDWERGTSLEKNNIKTRIDSEVFIKGFYELVLPTNISKYGTVDKTTYIGTPSKLKTIKQGDIIFGGEGFGKGRTFVVCEEANNIATNYHGIRIINKNNDLTESIFVRCFLAYFREKGMIDYIGVGGSGGHCAPSYFHLIETPLFPKPKQKEISLLYHNPAKEYHIEECNLDSFLEVDNAYNETAGIYELDRTAKLLKKILDKTIDNIINDIPIGTGIRFDADS